MPDTRYTLIGFDNPLPDASMDMLGRQPLMHQVYSQLTNLESNWSVRVGLIAPWGEGKTTICDWIIKKAEAEGHVAVKYSPWSSKTDAELYLGLYRKLISSLLDKGFKFKKPKFKRSWKLLAAWTSQSNSAQKIKEANEAVKVSLGLAQSIFSMSKVDVEALIAQLPEDKRIIVIIDDLDRVEKSLIPRFLLSLRDLMDLKRFSFLLPFDDEILSHALSEYGGTVEYGHDFLDKILDYRVYLSPASADKISSLFEAELERYCPFISMSSVGSASELLPRNPRKLKTLVRGLRVYQDEAHRHRDGEIDWKALLIGHLIKSESESFFNLYVQDTFRREGEASMFDTSGVNPWIQASLNTNEGEGERLERTRIYTFLEAAGIENIGKKERIYNLCESLRTTYGYMKSNLVSYAFSLLERSEALTWGEFDALWEVWSEYEELARLDTALQDYAMQNSISKQEMIIEFMEALFHRYGEILNLASSVTLSVEHEETIEQAQYLLSLLTEIIQNGFTNVEQQAILQTSLFEKLFYKMGEWIHFSGNEADTLHREREKLFLRLWVEKANEAGLSSQFSNFLKEGATNNSLYNQKSRLIADRYLELLGLVNNSLPDSTIQILEKQNGVINIMPYDAGIGLKELLLKPESDLWQGGDGSAPAVQLFSRAINNPVIQKNALDLLDLIRKAASEGIQEMRGAEVRDIFANAGVIKIIWEAAIATPIQFRRLSSVREIRKYIIDSGVDEAMLITPDWLLVGADRIE